jgi:3-hydroxyacyl-CoA dehydrogenase
MLDEYLKNVSVIGAAGKMGSGISLLLLQEMSRSELEKTGAVGSGSHRLNLIDMNERALQGLVGYLRAQMTKYAERNLGSLKGKYKGRTEVKDDAHVVADFADKAMSNVVCTTEVARSRDSLMVFEAVLEDFKVKVDLFGALNKICSPRTLYFTNTSSIPVTLVDESAGLDGRLVGFHFYNPPAVQKLLEIICGRNGKKELKDLAYELAKRLNKIIVPSNDIPGFIGNGHFLRDVLYSISVLDQLRRKFALHEAIYIVNRVTQDFMVRPMGIFQLHDYVGVDVCGHILRIMKTYLKDTSFESPFINQLIALKVIGGQFPDGSQKDGILKYDAGKIAAVYNLDEKRYVPLAEGSWRQRCDDYLGSLPMDHLSWKALAKDPAKDEKLRAYFKSLFAAKTQGAQLAREYLLKSREIARGLVSHGVANDIEDVNQVLQHGFYHLYGPENPYF